MSDNERQPDDAQALISKDDENKNDANAEKVQQPEAPKEPRCTDRLIISGTSKWKALFDMALIPLAGYSSISVLYFIAYRGNEKTIETKNLETFDKVVEALFILNIVANFF